MPNTQSQNNRLVEIASFGSNPGALRAWLFLPSIMTPNSPLVVALHGCTQTAGGYALGSGWSEIAERRGFAVLYPEQQRANNPNLCFNWFEPGDTRREAGEAASIRQMVGHIVQSQGIDPKRVYVTGLSAGGAMANTMLATYPEVFAGGAIIGGLPYGVAGNVGEAFERMQGRNPPTPSTLQSRLKSASNHAGPWPTIAVWHGTHDQTVRPRNSEQIVQQWMAVHGLQDAPAQTDMPNGHHRKIWSDANGRMVIESHSIKGMGHGVPLAANGDASPGQAGPYMLDVGISSTARIAHSWGLAAGLDIIEAESGASAPTSSDTADVVSSVIERVLRRQRSPAESRERQTEGRIAKVINDALRAAGLLR